MHTKIIKKLIRPFYWYFLITLIVPLVNNGSKWNDNVFIEHAVFVIIVPIVVVAGFYFLWFLLIRLFGFFM